MANTPYKFTFGKGYDYGYAQKKNVIQEQPNDVPSYYADYNDPMDIGSMADALFNYDARVEKYGFLGAVPIVGNLIATGDLLWTKTIKPITQGDFKALLNNTLVNFSETMDLVANPVKAIVTGIMNGEDVGQNLLDSIGVGGNGRKNFDYDTGSFASDITLEIISDPLNWISFGTKAIAGAAAKTGAGVVVESSLKATAKGGLEAVGESITKKLGKEGAEAFTEKVTKATQKYLKQGFLKDGKKFIEHNTANFQNVVRKINPLDQDVLDAFSKSMSSYLHNDIQKYAMSLGVLSGASQLYKTEEAFERMLLKASWFSSAGAPAWLAWKGVGKPAVQIAENIYYSQLKPYYNKGVLNIHKADEAYIATAKANQITKTVLPQQNVPVAKMYERALTYSIDKAVETGNKALSKIIETGDNSNIIKQFVTDEITKLYGTPTTIEDCIGIVMQLNETTNGAFQKQLTSLISLKEAIIKGQLYANMRKADTAIHKALSEMPDATLDKLRSKANETIAELRAQGLVSAKNYQEFTIEQDKIFREIVGNAQANKLELMEMAEWEKQILATKDIEGYTLDTLKVTQESLQNMHDLTTNFLAYVKGVPVDKSVTKAILVKALYPNYTGVVTDQIFSNALKKFFTTLHAKLPVNAELKKQLKQSLNMLYDAVELYFKNEIDISLMLEYANRLETQLIQAKQIQLNTFKKLASKVSQRLDIQKRVEAITKKRTTTLAEALRVREDALKHYKISEPIKGMHPRAQDVTYALNGEFSNVSHTRDMIKELSTKTPVFDYKEIIVSKDTINIQDILDINKDAKTVLKRFTDAGFTPTEVNRLISADSLLKDLHKYSVNDFKNAEMGKFNEYTFLLKKLYNTDLSINDIRDLKRLRNKIYEGAESITTVDLEDALKNANAAYQKAYASRIAVYDFYKRYSSIDEIQLDKVKSISELEDTLDKLLYRKVTLKHMPPERAAALKMMLAQLKPIDTDEIYDSLSVLRNALASVEDTMPSGALKDLQKQLQQEQIYSRTIKRSYVDTTINDIVYELKQDNALNTLNMLSDSTVQKMINNPESFYNAVLSERCNAYGQDELVKEIKETLLNTNAHIDAARLDETAIAYAKALNELYEAITTIKLQGALVLNIITNKALQVTDINRAALKEDIIMSSFLRSLQDYAQRNIEQMFDTETGAIKDYILNEFCDKINLQLSTRNALDRMSLDQLIKEAAVEKRFKEVTEPSFLLGHNAGTDVNRTQAVFETKLDLDDSGNYVIYYDLETDSVNKNTASIIQYAFKHDNKVDFVDNIKLDTTPDDGALRNAYAKSWSMEGADIETLRAEFAKRYKTGEAVKSRREAMLHLYNNLSEHVKAAQTEGKSIVFRGHNNKAFDKYVVLEELYSLRKEAPGLFDNNFDNVCNLFRQNQEDTLEMLKEQAGILFVTEEQRLAIKGTLETYASSLQKNRVQKFMVTVSPRGFQKTVKAVANDLASISLDAGKGTRARLNNPGVLDTLRRYDNKHKWDYNPGEVKEFVDSITDALNKNKTLGHTNVFFRKSLFDGELAVTVTLPNGIPFRYSLGGITQFLEAKAINQMIPTSGVRVKYDPIVNDVFDLSRLMLNERYLPINKVTQKYVRKARDIMSYKNTLKNKKLILSEREAIYKAVEIIQRDYSKFIKISKDDPFLNAAILYQQLLSLKYRPKLLDALNAELTQLGYNTFRNAEGNPITVVQAVLENNILFKYQTNITLTETANAIEKLEKKLDVAFTDVEFMGEMNRLAREADSFEEYLTDMTRVKEKYNHDSLKFSTAQMAYNKSKDTVIEPIREAAKNGEITVESQKKTADNIFKQQVENRIYAKPEDLASELAYTPFKCCSFAFDSFDKQTADFIKSQEFADNLATANLKRHITPDGMVYIYLNDTALQYNAVTKKFSSGTKTYEPTAFNLKLVQDDIDTTYIVARGGIANLYGDGTYTNISDSFGDILNQKQLETYYDNLPDEVKKAIPAKDILLSKNAETNNLNRPIFNDFILGTYAARKAASGSPYIRLNYGNMLADNALTFAKRANTKDAVTDLLINPATDMSFSKNKMPYFIDNGRFTLKDICNGIKVNGDHKLVMLAKQNNGLPKLISVTPRIEIVQKLIDKGATLTVVPYTHFCKLYDIFKTYTTNETLQVWESLIRAYKIGYLSNPATVMRNWADTYVKNGMEMGWSNASKYYAQATVMFDKFRAIRKKLAIKDKFGAWEDVILPYFFKFPEGTTSKYTLLKRYFQEGAPETLGIKPIPNTLLSYEEFKFMWDFSVENGGVSGAMLNALNKEFVPKNGIDWLAKSYSSAMRWVTNTNEVFEQNHRLAMYLYYSELGVLSKNEIYNKIAKTHFNYAIKSTSEQIAEYIIPFYTFTKNNIAYWIDAAMEHPHEMYNLFNAMTGVWDLDDMTIEEYDRNLSLQNKLSSGQLKLFKDDSMTLKLNPSITDVLNIFTNPQEAIDQRLVPIVSSVRSAVEQEDATSLIGAIPIAGALYQRGKTAYTKYNRTQNAVSALPFFGDTLRYGSHTVQNNSLRTPKYKRNVIPRLTGTTYNTLNPAYRLLFLRTTSANKTQPRVLRLKQRYTNRQGY